jgi:hypothetical protein
MDQARWLVVFSVVLSMIVTLTLLHRYAGARQTEQITGLQPVNQVVKEVPGPVALKADKTKWRPPAKIEYSEPPPHTFVLETPQDFSLENEEKKSKGRILE